MRWLVFESFFSVSLFIQLIRVPVYPNHDGHKVPMWLVSVSAFSPLFLADLPLMRIIHVMQILAGTHN